MKKRTAFIMLALALALCLCPAFSSADESSHCGEDLYWSFDSSTGTLIITGSGAMYNYEWDGQPWFSLKNQITSVSLPDGLTSIGNYAFQNCENLSYVYIPNNVKSVGDWAFSYCAELASVSVDPESSMESIGEGAFHYCYSLNYFNFTNRVSIIGIGAFEGAGIVTIEIPGSVATISDNAFAGCIELTDVYYLGTEEQKGQIRISEVGNDYLLNATWHYGDPAYECGKILRWSFDEFTGTLTITGSGVMYDYGPDRESPWVSLGINNQIVRVELPDRLLYIGSAAFYSCGALTSITIPNGVIEIGEEAFSQCQSLSEITIPNSLTNIGTAAFCSCTELSEVFYDGTPSDRSAIQIGGDNNALLGANWHYRGQCGNNLYWSYDNNSGVLSITGSGPMYDYNEDDQPWASLRGCIAGISLGDGMTSIGNYAFSWCQEVYNVIVPDGVTRIGEYAFSRCEELRSINFPGSMTNIGKGAFEYCSHLGMVDPIILPNGITCIEDSVFAKCYSLQSIIIPDGVTSIGNSSFMDCTGLESVSIPDSVTHINGWAFYYCTGLTSVAIPSGVTEVQGFYSCSGLTSVTFSDHAVLVSFPWCSGLTSITIPDSVTTCELIGCSGLKYLSIPCHLNAHYGFDGCTALETIRFTKGSGIGHNYVYDNLTWIDNSYTRTPWYQSRENDITVIIEEGVESIGTCAFKDCTGLKILSIPKSLADIHGYAFDGCDNLSDVYYAGTPEQRLLINIDLFNAPLNIPWHSSAQYISIISQPQDVTVIEGQTASFTVVAVGAKSYRWQWSKDGGATWINSSSATTGYNTGTLQVAGAMGHNGYQYRCKVSNASNEVTSKAATLTVNSKLVIITQPKDAKVKSGTSAKFTVKVKGKGVTYQWLSQAPETEDWMELPGETTATLTVVGSKANMNWKYRCRVRNAEGSEVYTVPAALTVTLQPPVIKTHPKAAMTVKSGAKAKISVKATGPNLKYQWYKLANGAEDWVEMEGQTKADCTFVATLADNGAQFRCRVWNDDDEQTSGAATLTVTPVPLTIKTQPKDKTVKSGSKAKLSVTASGPNLRYQWFERANGESPWVELAGQDKKDCSFTANLTMDQHQFYCHVWNDDEALDSDPATLTVTPQPPAIKTQPKTAVTVKSGAKARISVKATGPNLKYQWYKLANGAEDWEAMDGQTKADCTFVATLADNGAQFRCRVWNDDDEQTSSAATLTVTPAAPKFSTHPRDARVKTGDQATFKVKASGMSVTYQWYYRTSADGEWILMDGETDATLVIQAAEDNFGWQFRCTATADGLTADSKVATLKRK